MKGLGRAGVALIAVVTLGGVCAADAARPPRSPVVAPPGDSGLRPGATGAGDPYLPDAGNGGYDVGHYALDLRYNPATGRLDGRAVLDATATQGLSRFNLDFEGLSVRSITVGGAPARWERDRGELTVTPKAGLPNGTRFTVDVRYDGEPGTAPDAKTVDTGFLRTKIGAVALGEPTGAAEWFPVNNHPSDKAGYEFAITVPDGWTAVANGVPQGTRGSPPGWTTWRWRADEPMASYLAMMAVGRFRVTTATAGGAAIYSAVADSLPRDKIDPAIARTGEILEFLAGRFGPYPFAAAGAVVPDDPRIRYALETQTRPVYSPRFFGDTDTATTFIAHELAHQWYGDSVTPGVWRDIWLNEGFATYGQWLWDEHEGRPGPQEQFDEAYRDAGAMALPPGNPGGDNLFSPSVYVRGAMTLHALRRTVGDDAFFAILKAWAGERRHGTGTTAQFVALAGRVSGRDVAPVLDEWLYRDGKPRYP